MEASLKALGLEGKKTLIVMSADSMNDEALLSVLNYLKLDCSISLKLMFMM